MSGTVAACESLCQNLTWLPSAKWLGDMAPMFALIWAIYAYYKKRSHDRSEELRLERRKLYREFISQIQKLAITPRPATPVEDIELHRLFLLKNEFEIIAGRDVVEASDALVDETIKLRVGLGEGEAFNDVHLSGDFKNARRGLIAAMRTELNE